MLYAKRQAAKQYNLIFVKHIKSTHQTRVISGLTQWINHWAMGKILHSIKSISVMFKIFITSMFYCNKTKYTNISINLNTKITN